MDLINYKEDLDTIWQTNDKPSIASNGYAIERNLAEGTVLFIGINPSYNKDTSIKYLFYDFDHRYFQVSKDMADRLAVPYAHHDLYFVRCTDQRTVRDAIFRYPMFFRKQLDLTKRIIKEAKPKLIVVINADASRIFKTEFNLDGQIIDPETGAYYLPEEFDNIPVLFSGMLSGQRALDLGSRERLEWQIRRFFL